MRFGCRCVGIGDRGGAAKYVVEIPNGFFVMKMSIVSSFFKVMHLTSAFWDWFKMCRCDYTGPKIRQPFLSFAVRRLVAQKRPPGLDNAGYTIARYNAWGFHGPHSLRRNVQWCNIRFRFITLTLRYKFSSSLFFPVLLLLPYHLVSFILNSWRPLNEVWELLLAVDKHLWWLV